MLVPVVYCGQWVFTLTGQGKVVLNMCCRVPCKGSNTVNANEEELCCWANKTFHDLKAGSLYCGGQVMFPASGRWHYNKKLHVLLSTPKSRLQLVLFLSWNKNVIYEVWALTWKKTKLAAVWACKILVPSWWCRLHEEKMERASWPSLAGAQLPQILVILWVIYELVWAGVHYPTPW